MYWMLDVGCGQGYNSQELIRHGGRVTAIDLTSKALSLASQRFQIRHLQYNIAQADAQNLPFKDESFDFVHSSGVLHHIPSVDKAVSEIYRVLRKGGKASIMVYNKSSWQYWYKIQFKLRVLMTTLFLLPNWPRKILLSYSPKMAEFIPESWPSTEDITNAATDFGGIENPLSRVYTRDQARKLFHLFLVEGFATSGSPYKPFRKDKNLWDIIITRIVFFMNERFGWFLYVYLEK